MLEYNMTAEQRKMQMAFLVLGMELRMQKSSCFNEHYIFHADEKLEWFMILHGKL
jgi:hypothetical protein